MYPYEDVAGFEWDLERIRDNRKLGHHRYRFSTHMGRPRERDSDACMPEPVYDKPVSVAELLHYDDRQRLSVLLEGTRSPFARVPGYNRARERSLSPP